MGWQDFFKRNRGDSKRGGSATSNPGQQKHTGGKTGNAAKKKGNGKGKNKGK
jgi:hypothetical protein